jgi:hypothetical protein
MEKNNIAVFAFVALLLIASLVCTKVKPVSGGIPTLGTPTLTTSLSPPNVTLGQNVTWLIWADPNCSGYNVNLQIFDYTNWTKIFDENRTLSTLNECGSWKETVPTTGFDKHYYSFTAKTVIDGAKIESTRYLDLQSTTFSIYVYASPFRAIPGENVSLTIYESANPYVDAMANVTIFSGSNPSVLELTNVLVPSATGFQEVTIPTNGWVADNYYVNVTAISALGSSFDTTYFMLSDVILTIGASTYYMGQNVNISIRTYPSVPNAGLSIYSLFSPPVVDEFMSLVNGRGSMLYDSSTWPPAFYLVDCNVASPPVDATDQGYFYLNPFTVQVYTDKSEYLVGEQANITVSTTLPQAGAAYNLTLKNSTDFKIWSYASNLDSHGKTSVLLDTANLMLGDYRIDAVVNNTHYERSDYDTFTVISRVFDIYASVNPYTNTDYTMPDLNVTVVPQQTNANISIAVFGWTGTYYTFTKEHFNISTYDYLIPTVGMPNGTYYVDVTVKSTAGTNSTWSFFHYASGLDSDGDGLSDSQERGIGTFPHGPDTDSDGFFDGFEVYHGTNPLDGNSFIPEQGFMQALIIFCATPPLYLIAKKKRYFKQ